MSRQSLEKKNSKQNFLHGAIILTVGLSFVKIIGALFKVPLNAIIGEYGMGLFSIAYNFYGPIHSLTIAGFPVAISKLVSENLAKGNYKNIKRTKSVATIIFIFLGCAGTAAMLLGAPYYTKLISNNNALLPMLALTPAIFFGCLCAIYRGYYEGLRNMYPTALSEIIEAVSKLLIGLSAAIIICNIGNREFAAHSTVFGRYIATKDEASLVIMSYAAAGAILGVSVGSFLSFLFLFLRNRIYGDNISKQMLSLSPKPLSKRRIASILIKTAIPVGIGSIMINITGLIDSTFLQNRIINIINTAPETIISMYQGLIPDEYMRNISTVPNFLFGCYSLATTVFMLVPSITQAFSISALPNVSSLWSQNKMKEAQSEINKIIKISALISFPAGFGISAISKHISVLLYGSDSSTQIISSILLILGFASAASALSTPISSIFHGIGRADLPVKILAVGMTVKIIINYFLCSIPSVNIYGAAIGTLVCYYIILMLEIIVLKKVTGLKIDVVNALIKPLFCSIICCVGAHFAAGYVESKLSDYGRLETLICCAAGMLSGIILYSLSLFVTKCINKSDYQIFSQKRKSC